MSGRNIGLDLANAAELPVFLPRVNSAPTPKEFVSYSRAVLSQVKVDRTGPFLVVPLRKTESAFPQVTVIEDCLREQNQVYNQQNWPRILTVPFFSSLIRHGFYRITRSGMIIAPGLSIYLGIEEIPVTNSILVPYTQKEALSTTLMVEVNQLMNELVAFPFSMNFISGLCATGYTGRLGMA